MSSACRIPSRIQIAQGRLGNLPSAHREVVLRRNETPSIGRGAGVVVPGFEEEQHPPGLSNIRATTDIAQEQNFMFEDARKSFWLLNIRTRLVYLWLVLPAALAPEQNGSEEITAFIV